METYDFAWGARLLFGKVDVDNWTKINDKYD